ncbi:hypothetical protein [Actinoallomurus sp. CA-150999]|uniref:hypothetical protein n=1 Tax=Actinoallomurus sp. CA-150999 TaxID=3239887 RepID=UPI003D8A5F7B
MQSSIRVALVAGAIASIAGLAAPAAGADTVTRTQTASTARSAAPVEAATKWRYCQGKKPQVCGAQEGRAFKARALKTGSMIKGHIGIRRWNPKTNTGKTYWKTGWVTLGGLYPTVAYSNSKAPCTKGWYLQGVWKPQHGSYTYSAPHKCS